MRRTLFASTKNGRWQLSQSDWTYRDTVVCRLCDSVALTMVLDLGSTPLANELGGTELFPLVVMRCDDCEHHQLSIAVNPERLWGPNYPYSSGTSPVFRAHLEKLADEVAALKPGGRVLEIASNDGTLCHMLAAKGLHVLGLDPSGPTHQDFANRTHLKPLSWPQQTAQKFDAVIALNVFAHVDDLHGFTAAVKTALAAGGVFIVEVGYLELMCERGVFDTIYHEHMSFHTVKPLRAFFERHGLAIYGFNENESQGGSLRLYVSHAGMGEITEYGDTPDVGQLRERITLTKAGLSLALQDAGTVAGYGAPAKLTTLMYATGLDRNALTCIYDDNPLKVGKLTPGTLIPIVPSANLAADAPDTLILFAWNFASEIIPRLRAQGYKGRIVTPLPEVEVDEC